MLSWTCYLPKIFCLKGRTISVFFLGSFHKRQARGTQGTNCTMSWVQLSLALLGSKVNFSSNQLKQTWKRFSKHTVTLNRLPSCHCCLGIPSSRQQSYNILTSHSHLFWDLEFFFLPFFFFFPQPSQFSSFFKDVNTGTKLQPSYKSLSFEYSPLNTVRTWDFYSRSEQNKIL